MKRFLSILCTIAMLMSLCVSLPVYAANGPSADGDTFVIADFTDPTTTAQWLAASTTCDKNSGYFDSTFRLAWLTTSVGNRYLAHKKDSTNAAYDANFANLDFSNYDAVKINAKLSNTYSTVGKDKYFTIVLSTSDLTEEKGLNYTAYRDNEILYKEVRMQDYTPGAAIDIIVPLEKFETAFDQKGMGETTPVGSTPLSAIKSISIFPGPAGGAAQMNVPNAVDISTTGWVTNDSCVAWFNSLSLVKDPVVASAETLDSQMAAVVDGGTRKDLSLPAEIDGVSVSWSSDDAAIATNGTVTQPESGSTAVNLTAALSMSGFETVTRTYTVNVLAPDTGDFLIADFTDATTSAQWRAASQAETHEHTGYYDTAFRLRWLTNSVGNRYLADKKDISNTTVYDSKFVPMNFADYKAVKMNVKFDSRYADKIGDNPLEEYFTVVLSTSDLTGDGELGYGKYKNNEILYKEVCVQDYKLGEYVDVIIPLNEFVTAFDQEGQGASTPVGSTPLDTIKSISIFPGPAGGAAQMNVPGGKDIGTYSWVSNYTTHNIWFGSLSLIQNPVESATASLNEYMTNYVSYGTRLDLSLPTTMNGVNISWSSDNAAITADGKVTKPESGSVDVTLTATVSMTGFETQTKTYTVTVYAPDKNDFVIVDFSDPQAGIDWRASTGAKDKGNGWDEWDGGRYSLNWLAGIGGGTYLADHPEKFAALDVSDYSYIQLNIQPMLSIETDRTMAVVLSTGTLQDNSTVYKNHEILYYEIDLGDYTPSTSGYYKITIPFNKFKTAFDQVGNGASTPVGSTPLSAIKSISIAPIGMQQYGVTEGNAVKGWAFNKYAIGDATYHMACTLKSITLLQDAPLEVYSGDVLVTDVNFKKLTESNALKGKVEYTNKGTETANVTPVIAVYTNGVLSGVQMGSAVAVDAGATATITTPELTYNPTTNTDVKVYMWDMAKGMTAKMSSRIHSK